MRTHDCTRCKTTFPIDSAHTKIVRRDIDGEPQPPKTERLCEQCWRVYVREFLDK